MNKTIESKTQTRKMKTESRKTKMSWKSQELFKVSLLKRFGISRSLQTLGILNSFFVVSIINFVNQIGVVDLSELEQKEREREKKNHSHQINDITSR